MDVKVSIVDENTPEMVEIKCHEVNNQVKEIFSFVKSREGQLEGIVDGKTYEIPVVDIMYAEGVDNRVFIYSSKQVYETRKKLYEIEEMLQDKHFIRVSKSVLLNLLKVRAIKPALNGRFIAVLANKEEIIISRKYVSALKEKLKGVSN